MSIPDIHKLFLVSLLSLGLSFLFYQQSHLAEKAYQRVLLRGAVFIPLILIASISFLWSYHMLQVSSGADANYLYVGVASKGSPYVGFMQDQTPTLYAFHRAVLHVGGDNSIESLKKTIAYGNYINLAAMIACLAVYWVKSGDRRTPSALNTLSFLCVCTIGSILIAWNIEVQNANIWLAGPVSLYLLTAGVSRHKWSHFLGGVALGVGFMVKPCFLIIIAFMFFSALREKWRGKNALAFMGVMSAGLLGFGGSFLSPGIDLATYPEFLFEALPTVYHDPRYHAAMGRVNLSLLKYVPNQLVSITSLAIVVFFSALAFLDSKKNGRALPWFFITLLFSPIVWGMHLMAILPAGLILLMETRGKLKQILRCAVIVTAIFYASILREALVVNTCLLYLWAVEVLPGFSNIENELLEKIENIARYSPKDIQPGRMP